MSEQSINFKGYSLGEFEGKMEEYIKQMLLLQKLIFAGFPDYVNYKLHEYEKNGLCTPEMYILYIQSCLIVNARAYAAKHAIDLFEKLTNNNIEIEGIKKLVQNGFFIGDSLISFLKKDNSTGENGNGRKGEIVAGESLSREFFNTFEVEVKNLSKGISGAVDNLITFRIKGKKELDGVLHNTSISSFIAEDEVMSWHHTERIEKMAKQKDMYEKKKISDSDNPKWNELFDFISGFSDSLKEIKTQLSLYESDYFSNNENKNEEILIIEFLAKSKNSYVFRLGTKRTEEEIEKLLKLISNIYSIIDVHFANLPIRGGFESRFFNTEFLLEKIRVFEDSKVLKVLFSKCVEFPLVPDSKKSFLEKIALVIDIIELDELKKQKKEIEVQIETIKIDEEDLKQRKEKHSKDEKELETKQAEIAHGMLKQRIDLEYALNKSAIEELGFDKSGFYTEVDDRLHNRFSDSSKTDLADLIKRLEGKECNKDDLKEIKALLNKKNSIFQRSEEKISNYLVIPLLKTLSRIFGSGTKKEQLNFVLPALRASYLGEWKEFLMEAGRKILKEDESQNKETISADKIRLIDEKMSTMIGKFDEILGKDLDRSMKSKIFTSLMWFFLFETIIVFTFAWKMQGNADMKLLLNILIPVTIVQVTGMIYHMLTSLFPDGKKKEAEKEVTAEDYNQKIDLLKAKKLYEEELNKKANTGGTNNSADLTKKTESVPTPALNSTPTPTSTLSANSNPVNLKTTTPSDILNSETPQMKPII